MRTCCEAGVRSLSVLVKSGLLVVLLAGVSAVLVGQEGHFPPPPQRGDWDQRARGSHSTTEAEKQATVERLGKMLAWRTNSADTSSEAVFLCARATEILERLKQAKGNNFQFDQLASATEALLRAGDLIFRAKRASRIDENDKRDAALNLPRCYFRMRQADYFADLSGEKEAKQYVTFSRSLYQQARSAYDAQLYDRAQMMGDASSLIVMALENLAHASLRIPDPPVIK